LHCTVGAFEDAGVTVDALNDSPMGASKAKTWGLDPTQTHDFLGWGRQKTP